MNTFVRLNFTHCIEIEQMSAERVKKTPILIIVLGFLTALEPIAKDIYLPAFEDIADKLNTHISPISYTLSSFFIGLSARQLMLFYAGVFWP